jgi:hypothetical protein
MFYPSLILDCVKTPSWFDGLPPKGDGSSGLTQGLSSVLSSHFFTVSSCRPARPYIALRLHVTRLVPQPDHRLGNLVFITQRA